jgi:predicted PurR-regulated permease PerM
MSDQFPPYARLSFYLINASLLIVILYYASGIFIPLFFALLFSVLLYPLCQKLEKLKVPRTLAIFIVLLMLVALVSGLIMLLTRQFISFSGNIPLFITKINVLFVKVQNFLQGYFGVHLLSNRDVQSGLLELLNPGAGIISSTLSVTTGVLVNIGIVIVYTFFFLLYRNSFFGFIYHIFSGKKQGTIEHMLNRLQKLIQGYILGIFSVIFIIAVLNSIGLALLRIENAILLGTIAALFAIIPYIGVFVGAVLPFFVAFVTKDSVWYAVGVIGLSVVVHLLEGNIITPYFVGRRVRINPLTAVIGMLAGHQLWGISGVVLSIPIIAVIKSVFDSVPALKPYGYMLGLEISEDKQDLKALFEKIKHPLSS